MAATTVSSHLPEDVTRWPESAHELLGVAEEADDLTVRRAYARLIKSYKPEQYPEHFRRIRAAYEEILARRRFFEQLREQFPGFTIRTSTAEEASGPTEQLPAPQPVAEPRDDIETYWDWAIAGEFERSYAAMLESFARKPNGDLRLRLYWLQTVFPDLEPRRPAVAWLIEEMCETGLAGAAAEAYHQELQGDDLQAVLAGAALIDAPATPARFAEVTHWRWRTALWAQAWHVVSGEFDEVRDRVRPHDEQAWLALVFSVIDVLAWSAGDAAVNAILANCRVEVDQLQYHGMQMDAAFDRLEMLAEVTTRWSIIRGLPWMPPLLLNMLPRFWQQAFLETHALLRQLLAAVVADPASWLRHFDTLERHNPVLLNVVIDKLEQLQVRILEPAPGLDEVGLAGLTASLFRTRFQLDYATLRTQVLGFCAHENVRPEWLLRFVPDVPAYGDKRCRPLAQALFEDRSLRVVCWAMWLFWA